MKNSIINDSAIVPQHLGRSPEISKNSKSICQQMTNALLGLAAIFSVTTAGAAIRGNGVTLYSGQMECTIGRPREALTRFPVRYQASVYRYDNGHIAVIADGQALYEHGGVFVTTFADRWQPEVLPVPSYYTSSISSITRLRMIQKAPLSWPGVWAYANTVTTYGTPSDSFRNYLEGVSDWETTLLHRDIDVAPYLTPLPGPTIDVFQFRNNSIGVKIYNLVGVPYSPEFWIIAK